MGLTWNSQPHYMYLPKYPPLELRISSMLVKKDREIVRDCLMPLLHVPNRNSIVRPRQQGGRGGGAWHQIFVQPLLHWNTLGRARPFTGSLLSTMTAWNMSFQVKMSQPAYIYLESIPDICHGSHGYIRVNFFGRCKFFTDLTRNNGIFDRFYAKKLRFFFYRFKATNWRFLV